MDTSDSPGPRRDVWRTLRRTLFVLGTAVLSLVALTLAVLALFGERWANQYAQGAAADLSRSLGRPVQIGHVDVSALSGRVSVAQVVIGPSADEPRDAPALRVTRAAVNLGLLRTLLSLGFYPYVEEVRVQDLDVHVVKRADGRLNWETMSTREEPPPDDGELDVRVKNARLGELALRNGSVVFVESGARGEPARISQLALTLRDVGYRTGMKLELAAAVLSAKQNLKADAALGGLDQGGLPSIDAFRVTMQPTQLAPLSPFLRALMDPASVPDRALLSALVDVSEKERRQEAAEGVVQLADVLLPQGKPFDAALRFGLSFDREAHSLALRDGTLEVGPMQLHAEAQLEELDDAPALRRVELTSRALSFEAIRAIYPGFDALTAPMRMAGPFSLTARGGGDAEKQTADFALSLTETHIVVPDTLDKPAGTPLALTAKLETGNHAISIVPLQLQVADLAIEAKGKIEHLDRDAPSVSLQLDTPSPKVGSLLRLLPPIARATKDAASLDGALRLVGRVQGTTEKYEGESTLTLSSLQVNVPSATFEGSGSAQLTVRDGGEGPNGKLALDFTQLTALYADVFRKPRGTPFKVEGALTQSGGTSKLTLSTTLASLVMRADASLRGEAPSRTFQANVDVRSCAVRGLLRLLPGTDPGALGDIHFSGKLAAEGVTDQPASMRVSVPRFTAKAGRSELHGSLSAKNLVRPAVELTARSAYFDLSEFLPGTRGASEPRKAEGEAPSDDPGILARTTGRVDLEVQRGRAADVTFDDLKAQFRLADGRATAERLEVGVFGGRFQGTGSEFPLVAGRGDYELRGDLAAIQVASALEQLANAKNLLTGQLSGRVDVTARDLTPEALARSLTGLLQAKVADGALMTGHGFAALTDQLGAAAKLPALQNALTTSRDKLGIQEGKGWQLEDLAGALRFQDGSAVLDQPLTVKTPQGDVRLEGKVGLASSSDLRGTFALAPTALTALTEGKVSFDAPVPLPFQVSGPLTAPALRFGALDPLLQPLLRAFVRDVGEDKLREGADKVLKESGLKDALTGRLKKRGEQAKR